MKKIKLVLLMLVAGIIFPLGIEAASRKNVYIFKGDGCPHCEEALEFFQNLINDEEYTDKFDLVEYEVWNNSDNRAFANAVAEELGEEMTGVPYIIIGENSHSGFSSSLGDKIKEEILDYYNDDDATSVVEKLQDSGEHNVTAESTIYRTGAKSNADTVIAVIIIVIAIVGFGYVIYLSRKDTSSKYYEKPVKKEEVKEAKVEEVKMPKSTSNKKAKKKTTNKKTSK